MGIFKNKNKNKVITFGSPIFDVKSGKSPDIKIRSFELRGNDEIYISYTDPFYTKAMTITTETAESIGLINLDALNGLL